LFIRYREPGRRGATGRSGPELEVEADDLRMAQLTHLRLNDANLPMVIDTVGKTSVLILGRFTNRGQKAVLERLRQALRAKGLMATVFDFERPRQRDLTETILLLASMSVFIIAEMTSPRSVPLEMQAIAPNYGIPMVPIVREGKGVFGMFPGLRKYPWVLQPLVYDSADNLIKGLRRAVIDPALARSNALVALKGQEPSMRHIRDYLRKRPPRGLRRLRSA
jgi:hypothetical protein